MKKDLGFRGGCSRKDLELRGEGSRTDFELRGEDPPKYLLGGDVTPMEGNQKKENTTKGFNKLKTGHKGDRKALD